MEKDPSVQLAHTGRHVPATLVSPACAWHILNGNRNLNLHRMSTIITAALLTHPTQWSLFSLICSSFLSLFQSPLSFSLSFAAFLSLLSCFSRTFLSDSFLSPSTTFVLSCACAAYVSSITLEYIKQCLVKMYGDGFTKI